MPYFLKIEGIPGDSTDAKHKGEIEVLSFSWGISNAASPAAGGGAGGGTGRPAFDDLTVLTPFSKAAPRLFEACATGEHLSSAVLTGRPSGGPAQFEFVKLTLSDVLVSAYRSGTENVDALPGDQVSLSFARFQIEHRSQKSDGGQGGSTVAGFDVSSNQKI